MYVKDETSTLKRVLTCPPTFLKKAAPINEISKLHPEPLNSELLASEYQRVLDAYEEAGVKVEKLTPDASMTNSIFARDFGGCVKEGYILGRFKKELRFPERKAYEDKMKELGIPKIAEVEDGYFEGGDFAFLRENVIAVGMLDRTDEKGFETIKNALEPLGYEVHPVSADPRYLHLDMCFNLVDENLAVAYLDGLPDDFKALLKRLEIEVIEVPEDSIFHHGCNLESLGDHRVLSLKQNAEVNQKLREHGMDVIELDVVETLKAGGGPHCMTFPLARG